MGDAGLANPALKVDSVGPFYACVKGVSFDYDNVSLTDAMLETSYFPSDLLISGRMDSLTVDGARVDADLDALFSAPSKGGFHAAQIPFMIPSALDAIPARSLLVRDGQISFKIGGQTRIMNMDALVRQPSKGVRSATFSATGDNGDQILLSVEGQGGSDSINAEGSVDLFGWVLACGKYLGVSLPDDVALEAAPLVFQLLLDQNAGKPGKWVGVVSQPWLQYEKGPLVIAAEDMRAGVTGDASGLTKAAAEGDIFIKTGAFSAGPFHPSLSATDTDTVNIQAASVPLTSASGSMILDYVKGTAYMPEEGGDFSMRGSIKPAWFPVELLVSVSSPSTLDGVFVDIGLPRSDIEDVAFPQGWLPASIEGLQLGGPMDADVFLSAGGLTPGGFSASGRISADDAFIRLPVAGSQLEISGIRVRNARFSSLSDGFAMELPEGLKAAVVKLGAFSLSDVQLWPCHLSSPGQASMGSMTASLFGGRMISGAINGEFGADGNFTPTASMEMTCNGMDLEQLGAALSIKPRMQGMADISVILRPNGGKGLWALDSSMGLKSDSISVAQSASGFSVRTGKVDMTCTTVLSSDGDVLFRAGLVRPAEVSSLGLASMHFTGRLVADGWVQSSLRRMLAASLGDPLKAFDCALKTVIDSGDISFSKSSLKIEGLKGTVLTDFGPDARRVASDGPLSMSKAALGSLQVSNASLSFVFEPGKGLTFKDAKGAFFGGTIALTNFNMTERGAYAFSLKLEKVSAAQLLALFPQFKGSVEGRLDGILSLMWEDGELVIYPGSITMNPSMPAHLAYEDAEKLVQSMGQMNDMVRTRSEKTLRNMSVKQFTLEIKADQNAPIVIHLVGDSVDKDGIPVDLNLTLNGDIAESLRILFGKNIKVRFANAANGVKPVLP
jgi:hypothetical protein